MQISRNLFQHLRINLRVIEDMTYEYSLLQTILISEDKQGNFLIGFAAIT